jgi:hypothetical protein
MARTESGALLTDEHRQAQLAVRAATVRSVMDLWGVFNPEDIDASWARLEGPRLSVVGAGRVQSETLSRRYYRDFRVAEGVFSPAPDVSLVDDWRPRVSGSLYVTGPVMAKAAIAARRPDVATTALVRVAGAASRHAVQPGRDWIEEASAVDPGDGRLVGWRRVTSANPCEFCEMLAGRGAVYIEDTAGFQAHDHCMCTAEPDFHSGRRYSDWEFERVRRQRLMANERRRRTRTRTDVRRPTETAASASDLVMDEPVF